MYQAMQNVLNGFGAICGASLGGSIVDTVGWRWCFLSQIPVSTGALLIGHLFIKLHASSRMFASGLGGLWERVDMTGACLLVLGLSIQLVGLSLGGNELPWSNPWVIASLVASVLLLTLFLVNEVRTSAMPLVPLTMFTGVPPVATQITNVCVGMAAYAVSPSQVQYHMLCGS